MLQALIPLDDRHYAGRPAASISFLAEADALETAWVLVCYLPARNEAEHLRRKWASMLM